MAPTAASAAARSSLRRPPRQTCQILASRASPAAAASEKATKPPVTSSSTQLLWARFQTLRESWAGETRVNASSNVPRPVPMTGNRFQSSIDGARTSSRLRRLSSNSDTDV